MEVPAELVRLRITRGVILLSALFEDIDHAKFFVVVGVSEESVAGFFFVNSNINRYIDGKQELLSMQMPMRRSRYPFLKYDSFLSATRIERLPVSRIVESVKQGETEIKGQLADEDLELLLTTARASRLFSAVEKRRFLY